MRLVFLGLTLLVGCKSVPMDPSMSAYAAGDLTLVMAAQGRNCQAHPAGGLTICRVTEDGLVDDDWVIALPHGDRVESGELVVRYKSGKVTYPVTGPSVTVRMADIIGHPKYALDDDGLFQARGTIKIKGPSGPEWVDLLGIGMLVVFQRGYSPLPIDSPLAPFKGSCSLGYSYAGRSFVQCK